MENFRSNGRSSNRRQSYDGEPRGGRGNSNIRDAPKHLGSNSGAGRHRGDRPRGSGRMRGGRGRDQGRGGGQRTRQLPKWMEERRQANMDNGPGLFNETEESSELEQGKVVLIKEQYGFIRYIERDRGDVFFHLSEAPAELKVGSEVEFRVRQGGGRGRGAGSNKVAAVQLNLLPPGTLQFEEVLDGRFFGRVEKDLRGMGPGRGGGYSNRRSHDDSNREGCIRLLEVEGGETVDSKGPEELLPFFSEDLALGTGGVEVTGDNSASYVQPPRLLKGDEVELTLVVDKMTGKKRAKDITLHRTARQRKEDEAVKRLEESGQAKEKGEIQRIKDDFGFIRGLTGDKDIFFRMADVEPDEMGNLEAVEGAEVEYYVIADQLRGRESTKALKVKVLPPGTLEGESLVEGLAGKITRKARGEKLPGYVRLEFTDISQLPISLQQITKPLEVAEGVDADGALQACAEVPFWQEDAVATCRLMQDDIVLMDLLLDRVEGWTATNIRLLGLAEAGREEGMITNCCDNYGFIRCCSRTIDLYFSYRELVNPAVTFQEGTEVKFNIIENPERRGGQGDSRARASRVEVVPPGTVWFEKLLAEDIRGTVHREPKKAGVGVVKCPASYPGLPQGLTEEEFPELNKKLEEFLADETQKELWLEPTLTSQQRKAVHELAANKGLGHESQDLRQDNKLQGEPPDEAEEGTKAEEDGKKKPKILRTLKIWKLTTLEEIQAWETAEKAHSTSLGSEEISFTFTRDDLRSHKQVVRKGTEITFDVVFDRRRKRRIARNVVVVAQPVEPSSGEELGIIANIQEDRHFGFIERASVPSGKEGRRIFFHLSEFNQNDPAAKKATVGQEVAFTAQHRKGQPTAVNVRPMPAGTVQLQPQHVFYGLVALLPEEEPPSASGKEGEGEDPEDYERLEGKVVVMGLVEDPEDSSNGNGMKLLKQHQVLSFTAEDLESNENGEVPSLSRGDCVVFSVAISLASRTKTVQGLRLAKGGEVELSAVAQLQAKVTQVDAQAGVAFLEPEVPMGMPLSFKLQDVVGYFGPIRAGDMLDCLPIPSGGDSESNSLSAVGVVRLKDLKGGRRKRGVNAALKQALRKKGIQAQPHFIMAKGPDGTKGFAAGWRSISSESVSVEVGQQVNLEDKIDLEKQCPQNSSSVEPNENRDSGVNVSNEEEVSSLLNGMKDLNEVVLNISETV
mmetsp:Transcript_18604/g.23955  ORF Transcript_18604/g.23955 Transcript_18604/m.23955 type:complete len:1191 (-) Transcript_18604:164-3736(-)